MISSFLVFLAHLHCPQPPASGIHLPSFPAANARPGLPRSTRSPDLTTPSVPDAESTSDLRDLGSEFTQLPLNIIKPVALPNIPEVKDLYHHDVKLTTPKHLTAELLRSH